MDQETGCGLPLTGQKGRLLIGTGNSIGRILAAAVMTLACPQTPKPTFVWSVDSMCLILLTLPYKNNFNSSSRLILTSKYLKILPFL